MRSTQSIRVAVIGAGYWGRNLVRNYHALGSLSAVCDSNPAILEETERKYPDVELFNDVDKLVSSSGIHAVAIATPAATHGSLVALCLDGGKHVFVEKPLCLNVEEGERLVAQARTYGRTLMVGHLLLYHPGFVRLREIVTGGDIGELR